MRFTSFILALSIAAGLWYWFAGRHEFSAAPPASANFSSVGDIIRPKPAKSETAVRVVVLPSEAQQTSGTLIIRGRTQASRNVQVPAETTGRVISEPLRRGAKVKAGDVLCRLDPGVREADLAEAEAALAEAQAEATAATTLQQKGFAAETTLKSRQAQLRAAQARLDKVRWDIEQLSIEAPFDGVLESDTAELGSLLTPGAPCANVIDLARVKVAGFVAEQEVDQLSIGQSAAARLINGVTAEGTISFVSRVADAHTRTYAVEVTIDNPDGRIRDGMTAELKIVLPSKTAHLVPQSALTLDDDGRMGIRIDDQGSAQFVAVDILHDTGEGVWVTGLPDKVSIIVVGQEFVRDGRRIAGVVAGSEAQE